MRRLAFAVLYGPAARHYDAFTAWLYLGEWARWQETALPLLPEEGLVLELGAGTAALARLAVRPGRRWLATEPSAPMLRVARRRPSTGSTWLVRAAAHALPVASASADAVLATFPTSYIFAPATGGEIRRVLKPDGRLIVVIGGELKPHGLRRRLRQTALHLFYGQTGEPITSDFALPGFAGATRQVETPHGHAAVYVAVPSG